MSQDFRVKPPNMSAPQSTFIACAHMPCQAEAVAKVRTPTGWASLCTFHFSNQHQAEAREYCEQNGLDTPRKMADHIYRLMREPRQFRGWMRNPKSAIARLYADEILKVEQAREPGEDDELAEIGEALAERMAA